MSKLTKALTAAAGNAAGESLYVEDVFSTYLYEGSESAQTITNGIDLADEGGLVWLKSRSGAYTHYLHDSSMNAKDRYLSTQYTSDLSGGIDLTLNNAGFSIDAGNYGLINDGGETYASWTFRKAEKFFDVVTYTGNGVAGRTVAHNVSSVPAFMIVKRTDASGDWWVYHSSLGGTKYMRLNFAQAAGTATNVWNDTAPTDSVFSVGNGNTNLNGATYVAYLFASDAGGFGDDGSESIIKCGSYTGNGTNSNYIDFGFEPQWLLVKNASNGSTPWLMIDNMRGWPAAPASSQQELIANGSNAESTGSNVGITSTGIGITTSATPINASGSTYIYIAIRRPMKTPESGTEVFAADLGGSVAPDPWFNSGFPVDMSFTVGPSNPSAFGGWFWSSRLTSGLRLDSSSTAAEISQGNAQYDYMTGAWDTNANTSYFTWMFKRATGFFDVVAYTGNGTAGATQAHNLGVAPECMIVKRRDGASSWITYWESLGATKGQFLDTNQAFTSSSYWNDTAPTATQLTLGSGSTNNSGATFIAYLFATLAGVSKVGSYTGTGSNVDVDCGFSAGARFILIKRTDSTGDWYVWDSARGIVAGNDPYLLLNSTAAEVTTTDYIDPLASGFTVTSTAPAALNASGGTYIFLAIS